MTAALADELVLLIGHGTRIEAGNDQLRACAQALAAALAPLPVAHCFIELAKPGMPEGLTAAAATARRVTVLPVVLLAAGHARRDIPAAVAGVAARYPHVRFRTAAPLGTGAAMQAVLLARLAAAEAGATLPRSEILLLVVGRGGSDRRANAAVAALARRLQRRAGYGAAAVAYCDVAHPDLPTALRQACVDPLAPGAAGNRVRQVVVLPFLLFDGRLLRRLRAEVASAAAPGVTLRLAEPIGAGPELPALLLRQWAALQAKGDALACCP